MQNITYPNTVLKTFHKKLSNPFSSNFLTLRLGVLTRE